MNQRPHWRLPPGVSRGTWDYVQTDKIATDYDRYFSDSPLMKLDVEFIRGYLPPQRENREPPIVADLGCGSGRVARELVPRGYRMLNVDLSQSMLGCLIEQQPSGQWSAALRANLVELDALHDHCLDMAVCLFSSLGMIQGRKNRRRFLAHVQRCLKPKAPLVVHVHNRYQSLRDPGGPGWLLRSGLAHLRGRLASSRQGRGAVTEFGDRVYAYRGLPAMFLHIYGRRELVSDLKSAAFQEIEVIPITPDGSQLLPPRSWESLLPVDLRAGGFFAVARA